MSCGHGFKSSHVEVFDGNSQGVLLSVDERWEKPALEQQWTTQVEADRMKELVVSSRSQVMFCYFL